MESKSRDMEAEAELDKLEERLGIRPASAPVATDTVSVGVGNGATPAAPSVSQGEAEKALEELEKRLNKGN